MTEKDLLNTFYEWQKGWWLYNRKYIEKTVSNDHVSMIGTASNEYIFDRQAILAVFDKTIESRNIAGYTPKQFDKLPYTVKTSFIKQNFGYIFIEEISQLSTTPIRYTCIFQLEAQEWRIIHLHISAADPLYNAFDEFRSQENMQKTLNHWIENFDFDPHISNSLKMSKLKTYLIKASNLLKQEIS